MRHCEAARKTTTPPLLGRTHTVTFLGSHPLFICVHSFPVSLLRFRYLGKCLREVEYIFIYIFIFTVNVDIFALYIFLRFSRFSNIRENIYNLKITCIMPNRGNYIGNSKLIKST